MRTPERIQSRIFCRSYKGIVAAVSLSVFLILACDFSFAARPVFYAVQDVGVVEVDLLDLPCLVPTKTGIDAKAQRTLLAQHENPPNPALAHSLVMPDGRKETNAEQYARQHPLPEVRPIHAEPFHFDPETPTPPRGAIAVEGYRQRFVGLTDFEPAPAQVVWRWDVPEPMRSGLLLGASEVTGDWNHERFYPFRVVSPSRSYLEVKPEPEPFDWLYSFDAKTGLRWQRNLRMLPDSKDKMAEQFACTLDGRYMILIRSSEQKPEGGMEITVLDAAGKIISRTGMKGVFASFLRRNPSGNSFLVGVMVLYRNGKRIEKGPQSATFLLQNDGQIKGVFADTEGKYLASYRVEVAEDDAVAGMHEKGFVYVL